MLAELNTHVIDLYKNGAENLEVIGNFVAYPKKLSSTDLPVNTPGITRGNDRISFSIAAQTIGSVLSQKPVDFTNISKIGINVLSIYDKYTNFLLVYPANVNSDQLTKRFDFNKPQDGENIYDVSGVTGEYYIAFGGGTNATKGVTYISFDHLWLEQ